MRRYLHICEVCGKQEFLTPKEAYDQGWDYPPHFGIYGMLSPRTCPNCTIDQTVWFALQSGKKITELPKRMIDTIKRIQGEPENLIYDEYPASKYPDWKAGSLYDVGDLVLYEQDEYECKKAHTSMESPAIDTAHWESRRRT